MRRATPLFRFEPIDTETLARAAFPLAQADCQRLSLEQWHRQVADLRRKGTSGLERGHMAVISARGAVLAIFSFSIEGEKLEDQMPGALTAAGRALRQLVISDVIGCRLPGFDPEAVISQVGQRLAATCQCDQVLLAGHMHLGP